jgi:hypothetical protein
MFEKDLVIEIWLNGSKDHFEVLSAGQIQVRLLLSYCKLNVSSFGLHILFGFMLEIVG